MNIAGASRTELMGVLRCARCGAYGPGMPHDAPLRVRRTALVHCCCCARFGIFQLSTGSILVFFFQKYFFFPEGLSYGHTTVKAPYLIRTAQLSTVGPDQYYGRGLRGNLRCCMSFGRFYFYECEKPK